MKKSNTVLACVACAHVALSVSAVQAQSTMTGLTVKVHTTASVTTGNIDGAFTQATNAFRHDRGSSDVFCPLTLVRSGTPSSTSVTDGTISNSSEQNTIINDFSNWKYVIVVNGISFCAGTIGVFDVCSPFGISPYLMADHAFNPSGGFHGTPGNLLAHGFGRTLGVPSATNGVEIIDPVIFASDTGVRSCDHCNNYYRTNFGTGSALLWSLTDPAQTCANTAANHNLSRVSGTCNEAASRGGHERGRFRPVWRQQYTEKSPPLQNLKKSIVDYATNAVWSQVPTDLHQTYSQADADQLRPLLKDDALVAGHPKILSILGLVSTGAPADVEALADYFQRPGAEVAAAGMALGYIAARVDNELALDFLLTQYGSRDDEVARAALYGLALSGKPEALRFIRERRLEYAQAEPGNRANFKTSYDDAEKANVAIAGQGLKGYYRD